MAFFNKPDPALKRQTDLGNELKAKRANRDDLIERRKVAEANAAAHRDKASKLAEAGTDDAAITAAENAMRREQDRVATLSDALAKINATIGDLENEIAKVVDSRCRTETAAAIGELVEKWSKAGAAFDAVMVEMVEIVRESSVIVADAHPLKVFLEAVQQQVRPEANLIVSVLQGHAKGVLAGTAPASLPKPPPPTPLVAVEPAPEKTRCLFTVRSVKWRDEKGKLQLIDQYLDVEMPERLVGRALRSGACVSINSDLRRQNHGAHGGRHPNPDYAIDLDTVTDYSEAQYSPPNAAESVIVQANFTPIDRGPARTGTLRG